MINIDTGSDSERCFAEQVIAWTLPVLPGLDRFREWLRCSSIFYPESQGAFAERVRREAAARLALPCRLELGTQTEFPEPTVRINSDLLDADQLRWSEAQAWEELVAYYAASFGGGVPTSETS